MPPIRERRRIRLWWLLWKMMMTHKLASAHFVFLLFLVAEKQKKRKRFRNWLTTKISPFSSTSEFDKWPFFPSTAMKSVSSKDFFWYFSYFHLYITVFPSRPNPSHIIHFFAGKTSSSFPTSFLLPVRESRPARKEEEGRVRRGFTYVQWQTIRGRLCQLLFFIPTPKWKEKVRFAQERKEKKIYTMINLPLLVGGRRMLFLLFLKGLFFFFFFSFAAIHNDGQSVDWRMKEKDWFLREALNTLLFFFASSFLTLISHTWKIEQKWKRILMEREPFQ